LGRPSKPAIVLEAEGKSHRTKAELNVREVGEQALLTGIKMRENPEVKSDKVAHSAFCRINKLLKVIDKNDAITENIINRYCQLISECTGFEEKREAFSAQMEDVKEAYHNQELDASEYFKLICAMQKSVIDCDKQVQVKRRMLLDIEKESLLTIASALRNIPKKPMESAEDDPLDQLLNARPGAQNA